jgi:hypothetical protein
MIEVLDSNGKRVFIFEPAGSRYSVILGCAISKDGMRLGIICGIDQQRFLLLERLGSDDYRVVYHEYLGTGFRRPVHISFIDQDRWIAFERSEGIGCYEMKSRKGLIIPLDGDINAFDHWGGDGFLFVITSKYENEKEFTGIKLPAGRWGYNSETTHSMPEAIIIKAPFKSKDAFFGRNGSQILIGGGASLISFVLEKK